MIFGYAVSYTLSNRGTLLFVVAPVPGFGTNNILLET
jgi:hypothetical protein